MSGTFATLTPCGQVVFSPAGVIHWCGVPSLIHGVVPPCRCSVARLSLKQSIAPSGTRCTSGCGPVHDGALINRGSHGHRAHARAHQVLSAGRNRSPSMPVGSRLWKTIRTGLSLVAAMVGSQPLRRGDGEAWLQ